MNDVRTASLSEAILTNTRYLCFEQIYSCFFSAHNTTSNEYPQLGLANPNQNELIIGLLPLINMIFRFVFCNGSNVKEEAYSLPHSLLRLL